MKVAIVVVRCIHPASTTILSEVIMTTQEVINVLVDEAKNVVDRILKEDRRTMPPALRQKLDRAILLAAQSCAPQLTECTEAQIREACTRQIRERLAPLRPS